MNTRIEICTKEDESTTVKGGILERLVAQILTVQQFEVTQTVRVTGMEIDVYAKHKITNQVILVECKAHENALPADVITKLLGNIMLRKADACWLVTTGPLSKDAEGTRIEWEQESNSERGKLSFYTQDRILDLLVESRQIQPLDKILGLISSEFVPGDDAMLMCTFSGMFWIIPIVDPALEISSTVLAFDAVHGQRVTSTEQLNNLKAHRNSFSSFQWLGSESIDSKQTELLAEEYRNIVPVISGDDWSDYRPARPEDFVGRKKILSDILDFLESVNNGNSRTRLFSIKAPSGMGKSSVVLKLASQVTTSRKYSKKFFVYAVDVRTAMSARYAEMAIKSCFSEADSQGFTDVTTRDINSTTVSQYLNDSSIQKTLEYLKQQGKTIVIVFDQFEELFSQKGLYPLFDNVRVLCNEIDALQGPLVLGFAWKTDLTIPADHPAYYMWSNLADRRKEFELSQFKATEIKSAIKLFGRHLQEPVNPILNNYLTKQCQGYPWLLKKLCIHVFKLIHDGNSQDYVIGQRLNIVDLFERDISELTPDQHACVIEIAKSSPADYFSITETYGSDMVQTLINGRIVIRRASKLTLYWDIFRDYVLNKTVPELMLDYIPQQQFRTDMRAFACLIDKGDLASSELGKELSVSTATIDNIMIDAVMFGVAQRNSNTIHIIPDSKEALISTLQAIFKKHTVYVEIKKLGLEYFNYSHFAKIFHTIYTDNNINGKTKATYCSKLYNWFVCLGLFEEAQGQTHLISAPSAKSAAFNLDTRSRRGRYQSGGQNLFWGQTSPEKMICAYNLIDSGRTNYNELKSDGYRNAIEALVAARAIRKSGDEVHTICSLPQAFANIEQSDTIVFAKSLLENNPSMKSDEMGIKLEEKFTKKWKSGSRIRYGNAVIVGVKYLAANDHN